MRKKNLLLRFMLLLCALMAGVSGAWADEVVAYTLTPAATGGNSSPHNSYTSAATITIDNIEWSVMGNSSMVPWRIGGKSISEVNRDIYSNTAISDNISKIEVTHGAASSITVNSWTVIVSKNADFSNPVSTLTPTFTANETTTITRPEGKDWSDCYFKLVYNVSVSGNSNRFIEFSEAKFYKETGTQLSESDLSLSATSLSFDLYDDKDPKTITCTTHSTGAVTVSGGTGYVTTSVSGNTITVTPTAVTPSEQTITVSQEADATYAAGSKTFTVTITDHTPYQQPTTIEIIPNYTFWGKAAQFSGTDYSELSGSKDNVTLGWTRGSGSTYANQSAMRFYKDNNLTFTAPTGYEINSIELTVTGASSDLSFSPAGYDSQTTTWSGSASTVTMSRPSNASSYATISKFTITIALPSSEPSISAGDVDIAYNATGGSIAFTLSNPVDGGLVTATTEANWLTPGNATSTSPISFECSANSETTARTATVTLTYTYGNNQTVTKNVTVTQAAAPVVYTTIPALYEAATSTETNVNVTFGNWVVSAVHNNQAFVTDNSGNGFIIYKSNHGFAVNDKLSGTVDETPLKLYNGSAEFTNLTASTPGLTVSKDGEITVITNKSIADLGGVNTGAVITLSNLTYDGTNLSDGTNNIKPYNTLYSSMSLTSGKTYNITGVYQQYGNNTKEILPRSAADIEEVVVTVPSITLDSYSVNATENSGLSGTINVTYDNITTVAADIAFYASDGTTTATYDWITVGINSSDNVEYLIDANDGAARTAYFKVWAYDDNMNEVYSDLVTVTQAAYVAPATANNWVAANLADINANDVFVIVGNNGDTYAMSNDNGTSAPSAVSVTVVGSTLSGTIANNIKWNISGNATDGYTFYPNGDTESWLYCTNTNNGVKVGTGAAKHFKQEDGYLTTTETTDQRFIGIYNSSDWRCYKKDDQGNIASNILGQTFTFYKQLAAKLNNSGYATFSATVPVDFSQATDFTAWAITEITGTNITFSQITGAVPANTGVLLKGTAGETIYPTIATSGTAPATNLLEGISTATLVAGNAYYGLSGNQFVKVNAGTVPAGKALLPASAIGTNPARLSFFFEGEDTTTGISTMHNSEFIMHNEVYNLNGQRVNDMKKGGLYIMNGKKVIMK